MPGGRFGGRGRGGGGRGGGYHHGPNRHRGGGGRGGGRDNAGPEEGSSSGASSGRGGGIGRPPPHLRGREIGMWYARKQKKRGVNQEIEDAAEVQVDPEVTSRLTNLLVDFDNASVSVNAGDGGCSFSTVLDDINYSRRNVEAVVTCEIQRNEDADRILQEDFNRLSAMPRYKDMLKFRQKLPSFKMMNDVVESISASPVVVISGETGCGKTTQVAQYVLDDMILKGNGSLCNILCTQPRRISAITVAERVASERCENVGGKSVGYVIRLDSKRPSNPSGTITFCTTGVVFQYLKDDPYLRKYSHVFVDEVHERDTNSDILLTILKDLLRIRKDLKVILMSATINSEHFSKYFSNCPMQHIPGMTFPVQEFYLEDIIEKLKFHFEDNVYFREHQHVGYLNNFIGRCMRDRSKYSNSTIKEIQNGASENFESLLLLTERLLVRINEMDKDCGAVLVFLPGWGEISKLHNHLSSSGEFPEDKYIILPLHSMMPTINQRQIFDRPPPGIRKIIIATNIAETSITIDDVVHVIDFGKIKLTSFDQGLNIETLDSQWISKANAKQRRGRAGRVQEGYCYRIYTRARESTFKDFLLPEILRKRLEEVILQLKLLRLGNLRNFFSKLPDSPSEKTLDLSFQRLKLLHALDDNDSLTPLGFHLSHLPMHPQIGKMILLGAVFSCVDPVFSVAAALSYKDPFVIPLGKEHIVDAIRKALADGCKSDHIVAARALEGYENALARRSEREYCFRNFLSPSTCKLLVDFKGQFCDQLYSMRFLRTKNYLDAENNINSNNIALIKAVICAGLYPNVAKVRLRRGRFDQSERRPGPPFPVLTTAEDGKAFIHKKSVNAEETEFESPFVVYHLKQKLKNVTVYDTTMMSPYPLIFFGGKLTHRTALGLQILEVDGNIRFKVTKADFDTIEALQSTLDKILGQKISSPCPTDWKMLEGQLLKVIIDLITAQYHLIMSVEDGESDPE